MAAQIETPPHLDDGWVCVDVRLEGDKHITVGFESRYGYVRVLGPALATPAFGEALNLVLEYRHNNQELFNNLFRQRQQSAHQR